APLPNGQLAALSQSGPVITKKRETGISANGNGDASETQDSDETFSTASQQGATEGAASLNAKKSVPYDVVPMPCKVSVIDLSAMPDNRVLVSTAKKALAVVDPITGEAVKLHQSTVPVHSVAFVGEKTPVRIWPDYVDETLAPTQTDTTGYLYCADVFNSKQTNAEWDRVRGARVYAGSPMRMRSARHQYGHVGTVGVELGTFPLMPDGSFYLEVPADTPLAMQAVDAEGRPVVNEISWIYTRPGEFRSCVGCHSERSATPGFGVPPTLHQQPINLAFEDADNPKFRANNGANGAILNQQLDRMRETISVDLYPNETLGTNPNIKSGAAMTQGLPGETAQLLDLLKTSKSEGKRFAAIQRLSILRPQDEATRKLLCEVLAKDKKAEVRMEAAVALATCAKADSVPSLLAALEDKYEPVGHAAHNTLEHITGNTDFESRKLKDVSLKDRKAMWEKWFTENSAEKIEANNLAKIAKKHDWTKTQDAVAYRFAVESLSHYGTDKAKDALRKLLSDEWKEMDLLSRVATIRALGYLNDENSIPILSGILMESCKREMPPAHDSHEFGWTAMPDHTGGAAAEALGRIGLETPEKAKEIESALIKAFDSMGEFWFYSFRIADHDWLMGSVSSIIHARILEALDALDSKRAGEIANKILLAVPIDSDRGMLLDNDVYETVTGRVLHRSGVGSKYLDACLDFLEGKEIA
ncbi:MAG: HEAT repeat domain-containing protein, partial [Thermoguttaceae bacterium]